MQYVNFGNLKVSRFILGSNPFSGFSHQSPETDLSMKRYFTAARIKQTLHAAAALGINTLIGRSDAHVMRLLLEYWDEGGTLQWFAQTCPELGGPEVSIARAASGGAHGCYIHGGVMDFLLAQQRLDEVPALIDQIRQKGMLAGIAGHNPGVFEWAAAHLDIDFSLCCYYNPTRRDERAEHVSGMAESYREKDRQAMTAQIAGLRWPVVHYKILAAGRNNPAEAFDFAARQLRDNDAVCVGVGPADALAMLRQDVELLDKSLATVALPAI